jgi:hypothetical protein
MPYRLARLISIVFHPVLMPSYALVLLVTFSDYFKFILAPSFKIAIFSITILNTLLIPLSVIFLLYKRGLIKSFNLETRQERIMPLLLNAALMLVTYFMLIKIGLPKIFSLIMLGAALATLIAVIVTYKWKLSLHMIGIGGIIGLLFSLTEILQIDFRLLVIICFLLAGLIGVARMSLQSHKQLQLYAGFLTGFFCEYFVLHI